MSKPTLETIIDFTSNFRDLLKVLQEKETLVGIPENKTERKNNKDGTVPDISNAAILYMNEFGSPAQNIPPSNAMSTGIKLCQDEVAEQFKKCVSDKSILSRTPADLDQYYNRAGFIASQSCKKVINDQIDMKEPSPATLAARKSQGFKGTKRLIVTGQTRNAITFAVRDKKGGA